MIQFSKLSSSTLVQHIQLEVRGVTTRTLVDTIYLISSGIQNRSETSILKRLVASCFQTIPCQGKSHQSNYEDLETGS